MGYTPNEIAISVVINQWNLGYPIFTQTHFVHGPWLCNDVATPPIHVLSIDPFAYSVHDHPVAG